MILRRAELWSWQGLEHVVLDDLSPGLNVVLAPNESGKSRVFRAVRFALFESHRGAAAHKKAIQSWGRAEAPRVEVHFEQGGTAYRVEKQFLKGPYALLEGGGRTLRDQEAETRLAELLGLDSGTARKAGADQLGLWPLLWVEQFSSSLPPHDDLSDASRARLQDLLSAEIGEIAAGPLGESVLKLARGEAARYWTPKGWKETEELRSARKAFEDADRALGAAREEKAKLARVAARLGEVEQALRGLVERLDVRRSALDSARERAQRAGEALARAARQAAEVEAAAARRDKAVQDLNLRREREGSLEERQRDLSQARSDLDEGARGIEERSEAFRQASLRVASAEKDVESAQARLQRSNRQDSRVLSADRLRGLEQRWARVGELRRELRELAEALAGVSVTRDTVASLQEALAAWERARAKLEGASAQVRVRARRDLETPEGPLPAGSERTWVCPEPKTIALLGVADIEVTPGGEGLPLLQAEERQSRARWESLLRTSGAVSLAEAQDLLEKRQLLETRAKSANAELKRVCPEGESVLEASVAKARRVLEELGPEDPEAGPVAVAEAEVERCSGSLREVRGELGVLSEALGKAREVAGAHRGRATSLAEEARRLEQLLEEMAPKEALAAAAGQAAGAWEQALAAEKELQRQYAEVGGDGAAADVEREELAWGQLEGRRRELHEERLGLLGQLRALSGEALHEQEQEAEAAQVESAGRLREAERRAAAARKLLETLEAAQRSVQERLTAPVVARIHPLLEQLFPGSRLSLSEKWEVEGLATGDTPEPFDDLSGGAREQLGVLVRLGLAEVFAGQDRLPLILDDALVHSDPARLAAMHRILYQAAKRLQIIVFSCHEAAFDGLGAERRYTLGPPKGGRGGALP